MDKKEDIARDAGDRSFIQSGPVHALGICVKIEIQNPAAPAATGPSGFTASAQTASGTASTGSGEFSQTLSNRLSGEQASACSGRSAGAHQAAQGAPIGLSMAEGAPSSEMLAPGLPMAVRQPVPAYLSPVTAADIKAAAARGTAEKLGSKTKDAVTAKRDSAQPAGMGTASALSLITFPAVAPLTAAIAVRTAPGAARGDVTAAVAVMQRGAHSEIDASVKEEMFSTISGKDAALPTVAPGDVAAPPGSEGVPVGGMLPTVTGHQPGDAALQESSLKTAATAKSTAGVAKNRSADLPSQTAALQAIANKQASADQSSKQPSNGETAASAKLPDGAAAFLPPPMPAQADSSLPQVQEKPIEQGAGTAIAGEPQAGASQFGVSQINSASVLQSLHGSEMRVGLHSPEFGSISIATTLSPGNVAAQITLDHSALSRALAVHLPGMEQKLASALGVTAKVEMQAGGSTAQSDSSSGQTGNGGAQMSQQPPSRSLSGLPGPAREAPRSTASPPMAASTSSDQRLSIQA